MPSIKEINNYTTVGSSICRETWLSNLLKVINESEFLEAVMSQTDIIETFRDNNVSKGLLQIAKVIQVLSSHGIGRDFFFVEYRVSYSFLRGNY